MAVARPKTIDVLMCTFRRPQVIETIASLNAQVLPPHLKLRVIVADNDDYPSAEERVRSAAIAAPVDVRYIHAPARNISIARNACLDAADADWVAFIDDDEHAAEDWLMRLYTSLSETGTDAVFGPALAIYPDAAPDWMKQQDHHSNVPVRRGAHVTTGHTCNALLRWRDTPWAQERFELARGRSGGEDTEFFFRLRRKGAQFEVAEDAVVFEPTDPTRLSFAWLRRRKFRMGQSYAASAEGLAARMKLGLSAAAKMGFCFTMSLIYVFDSGQWRFWALRGFMHAGVVAGCASLSEAVLYAD